ncbi:MAG: DUF2627 family protein [Thermoactinomyces sp.]|jgi:hypothetical protein
MKPIYQRIVAIIIMCLPGILAIYGWTLMRDILFDTFAGKAFAWLPFLGGLTAFIVGIFLLGSFIFYRDKKRNKVQAKLLGKKKELHYKNKPGF